MNRHERRYEKLEGNDVLEDLIQNRDIVGVTSDFADLVTVPTVSRNTNGGSVMEFRAWRAGGSASTQAQLKFFTFPSRGEKTDPKNTKSVTRHQGAGVLIADVNVTFGGLAIANKNPITGLAETGVTFNEMSAVASRAYALPSPFFREVVSSVAPTSGQLRFFIDMAGHENIFCEIPTIGAISRIVAGFRRVE